MCSPLIFSECAASLAFTSAGRVTRGQRLMVTGVMGGREQAGNWRSPLTQIFHAQSELMVAAVERHRTAVLVYGDELLLKASYSYLHDLTLMKQNTSAGGSGMFPNEQACITLFDFLCCCVAFLQARPSAETGKDTKNIQLVWQGIRIYELYLTCGLCKVNTTVSLCSG